MNKTQRIAYIEEKRKAVEKNFNNGKFQVPWEEGTLDLPIIKLEKDFLRYRLENGRTQRKQLEYIERPSVDKDLFKDPESEKTQLAQHEILLEMAEFEGLKEDVIKYGLRDPVIITYDGFVLNGNRRLAVLRESTDEEYVKCVVLPKETTPKELYDLELDLQMAKEMKADYNWVDELLTIRRGIDVFKEKDVTIAKKMRIGKIEVNRRLNMLRLVDLYLNWLKSPGKYFIFGEKDEQVFIELEKFTRNTENEEKQKLGREIVFGILQNPPEAGRLYKHVTMFFRNFDETLKKFQKQQIKSDGEDKGIMKKIKKSRDPLYQLAQAKDLIGEETVIYQVSPLFENPESAKKHIDKILEYSEDVEALELEKKDKNASFNLVGEVQRKLQSVIINSQTANKTGIKNKLKEIIVFSQDLIKKIDNEQKGE